MSAELQIIKTYGPGAFVALIIIALLLYGLKTLLAETIRWLSKIVGRKLEQDAEHYRHQLGKEMETYKNELSRSLNVDRIRSEVRRAVAERLLDRRITAFHEVHVELSNFPSWVISVVCFPFLQERYDVFFERMEKFGRAIEANGLHFPTAFVRDYHDLRAQLLELVQAWHGGTAFDINDPRRTAIIQRAGTLQSWIESMHRALPDEISGLMVESPLRAPSPPANAVQQVGGN